MIRAIFFDYDGVLTTDRSGSQTTFRHLSEASGMAIPIISDAFAPYQGELLTGRTNHAQIWHKACAAMGRQLDISLLTGAFESTPPNQAMFSLARMLAASHTVGIITDNSNDRMEHLRKHQSLDALFDPIVVSADVGSSKQGPDIFRHAAARAGVAPGECIFIDNSEANVAMARSSGMRAAFHDDGRNDVDALVNALGVLGAVTGRG